ncbi:hypothetical protein SLE2022_053760 [Rubroshorea leprosula]
MENQLTDALTTIASRVPMAANPFSIQIVQKEQPIYHGCEFVWLELPNRANWRYAIYSTLLQQKSYMPLRDLFGYVIISCKLYYRLPSEILPRCVSDKEAYHRLREIHDRTCGHNNCVNLYHQIQRAGYYWLDMALQSIEFQQ